MEIGEQIRQADIALSGTLDLYRIWAKKHPLNDHALVLYWNNSAKWRRMGGTSWERKKESSLLQAMQNTMND